MFPKIGGFSPKMDGENHGHPYHKMFGTGYPRVTSLAKHHDSTGGGPKAPAASALEMTPDSNMGDLFGLPFS